MTDEEHDAMLDRLDRGEPAASPEEEDARRPYQNLVSRIHDLPDIAPRDGWERRLDQRRQQELSGGAPRRRWYRAAIGASLAATALAALLVVKCRGTETDKQQPPALVLETDVKKRDVTRRGDDAIVGDTLVAGAKGPGARTELWIYRDDALVVRCPADARCRFESGAVSIGFDFDRPGTYVVLAISGDAVPSPSSNGLTADQIELENAGARFVVDPPIRVKL